jgi:hypothetical protein
MSMEGEVIFDPPQAASSPHQRSDCEILRIPDVALLIRASVTVLD